jgi:hypothetical protein
MSHSKSQSVKVSKLIFVRNAGVFGWTAANWTRLSGFLNQPCLDSITNNSRIVHPMASSITIITMISIMVAITRNGAFSVTCSIEEKRLSAKFEKPSGRREIYF